MGVYRGTNVVVRQVRKLTNVVVRQVNKLKSSFEPVENACKEKEYQRMN